MIRINKKVLSLTIWTLVSCAMIVILGFTGYEQKLQKCKGLKIRIADETGNYFIEPKDIVELLNSKAGRVKQLEMKDVDLSKLERLVYTNPYVKKAEVYSTIDGYVNIEVWQRDPIVRVVNIDNEHFYIDREGEFMPVTDKYTCQVPVASGFIYDRPFRYGNSNINKESTKDKASSTLKQLFEIAEFLQANEFWNAQIEQIYVNEISEIELIPRVGNHAILIGSAKNLNEKMNNLLVFYNEGISKKGWDKYSRINLKFENQVICTKAGS